jgi:hypothetical protein
LAAVDKPNEYREHAVECLRLALHAPSAEGRALLEKMSELWLDLAVIAERSVQWNDDVRASDPKRPLHS